MTYPPLVSKSVVTTVDVTKEWHNVIVSFSSSVIKMYYDGDLVGSTTGSFDVPNAGDNGTFYIGSSGGNDWWYKGLIDEFVIYDYQMTDTQAKTLYDSMKGTTVKAVPDDLIKFSRQNLPQGILDHASTIIITKGQQAVSKDDLIVYDGKNYNVISVQEFPLADVVLAKQVVLEEKHDN